MQGGWRSRVKGGYKAFSLHIDLLRKYGSINKIPYQEKVKADRLYNSIDTKVKAWIYARKELDREGRER